MSSTSSLLLSLLDNDSLRSVLVRVPAEDHNALRQTCKLIRDEVDSALFKRERNRSGWVQAHATLLTPRQHFDKHHSNVKESEDYLNELFNEEYNAIGNIYCEGTVAVEAKIWIDGKLGGFAALTLIPRTRDFLMACDGHSNHLCSVGAAFCDSHGRDSLACVKEALRENTNAIAAANYQRDFIYLDEFELKQDYRESTTAGALALRSLFTDSPILKWSLIAYVADSDSQCTEEDLRMAEENRNKKYDDKDPEWRRRLKELQLHDMRQFLRAGFRQVVELVHESTCLHMFCLPEFLNKPLPISHDDAMACHITTRPEKKTLNSTDKELLDAIDWRCDYQNTLKDAANPNGQDQSGVAHQFAPLIQQLSEKRIQFNEAIDELGIESDDDDDDDEAVAPMETDEQAAPDGHDHEAAAPMEANGGSQSSDTVRRREELQHELQQLESVEEMINQCIRGKKDAMTQDALQKLAAFDKETREEVKKLIEEKGASAAVAIHCCASKGSCEYLDVLLDFLPEHVKVKTVVNSLDTDQQTPLMCVVKEGFLRGPAAPLQLAMCEKLIDLGANKDMTNIAGKTAYGCFCTENLYAIKNWKAEYFSPGALSALTTMKQLLEPLTGPTAADRAAEDAVEDENSDSDMIDEDDDAIDEEDIDEEEEEDIDDDDE